MNFAAIAWLAGGAALIFLETFIAPGIGIFFAGLGAVTTGALVVLGFIPYFDTTTQFVYFFVNTTLWAIALWKPLKHWRSKKNGGEYQNIIGDFAITEGTLSKDAPGKVKWSGTLMNARLAADNPTPTIAGGQQVQIVGIHGNTVTVKTSS